MLRLNEIFYRLRQARKYARLGSKIAIEELNGFFQMGLLMMHGELTGVLIRPKQRLNLGLLSSDVITNAGVTFMRDDFNGGSKDITNFNFHDSGTGSTAEAVGDTDLVTPAGPTTRAAGTQSAPASNQYQTVGTITYTGSLAITEHGVFNQSARGAGTTLWDRSIFTAINVAASDSIQFTYVLTITAGG